MVTLVDTRAELPSFTPGNAAAMPDVRLARRAITVPREAQTVRGAKSGPK
jgi:hypothetical protein